MSESDLFKIEEIPGMGLGVVALKDIPKRTLILKESPQFVVHDMWNDSGLLDFRFSTFKCSLSCLCLALLSFFHNSFKIEIWGCP